MRSLRIIAVLSLLLCLFLTSAVAQYTYSGAGANTKNGPACNHDSSYVNGLTQETCSASKQQQFWLESATAAASADYSGLVAGGDSLVAVYDLGYDAEAGVNAIAGFVDRLYPADFPAGSFLVVVYGLVANPTGSWLGGISGRVNLQPSGGKSVDCPPIEQFGANSCSAQVGINPGDSVNMTASFAVNVFATCALPTCGWSTAGFEVGYKKPGGGKVLLVAVVDGKGNPIKGAKTTTASGHEYPSKFASTTVLKSHPNPSTQGQAVKFIATVSSFGRSDAPAGKVTFTDTTTGTTLGHATLKAGVATFTTSALVSGTHAIIASYGGDIWSAGSKSDVLNQVVN